MSRMLRTGACLAADDDEKRGTVWSDEELDLIVADYFAMLAAEQAGRVYVKSHHSAALMARIGRSHRSVEFKHMNISAVLAEERTDAFRLMRLYSFAREPRMLELEPPLADAVRLSPQTYQASFG